MVGLTTGNETPALSPCLTGQGDDHFTSAAASSAYNELYQRKLALVAFANGDAEMFASLIRDDPQSRETSGSAVLVDVGLGGAVVGIDLEHLAVVVDGRALVAELVLDLGAQQQRALVTGRLVEDPLGHRSRGR